MNGFVASDALSILDGKQFTVAGAPLMGREVVALREFFRAEEDERLGRWRWPENPDYVVYPDVGDAALITVLDEKQALIRKLRRESYGLASDYKQQFVACAEAYFAAHPEPKKPWEDAKAGEVWVLTIDGEESAFYPSKSLNQCFTPVAPNTGNTAFPFSWPDITAGRRIFPEGDTE